MGSLKPTLISISCKSISILQFTNKMPTLESQFLVRILREMLPRFVRITLIEDQYQVLAALQFSHLLQQIFQASCLTFPFTDLY